MSQSLSNVQSTLYGTLVKQAYQAEGYRLADSVVRQSKFRGRYVTFPKMGQLIATRMAYQGELTAQDPGFAQATAMVDPWDVTTAVADLQELTVDFDVQSNLARAMGWALGRRSDQLVIDAQTAAGQNQQTIAIGYGGSNAMNYGKMLAITRIWDNLNIPPSDRFLSLSPRGLEQLMYDDHFVNKFYLDNDAMRRGTFVFQPVLGMNVRSIGQMQEGGLPLTGNNRTAIAWHKASTGLAVSADATIQSDYILLKKSYLLVGSLQMGATIIDPNGIILLTYDETVQPAVPGDATAKIRELEDQIKELHKMMMGLLPTPPSAEPTKKAA